MQVDADAAQVYASSSSARQLGLARNHHMNRTAHFLSVLLILAASPAYAADVDPTRILEPTTLNDYFPMTPSANRASWEARRKELREQVLVATGLWPMPEKIPLQPVIHGKIDRADYTIEKVFFVSYPGHYVSGNLYRPKVANGPRPGVLCPHGHWLNGRFFDAGEKAAREQIAQGA